ncbi:MAG: hypothetical protein JNK87_15950 [Bryobacterales bacterium]|nr:hypothetical protein [Bryobacterales bacterium]
MILASAGGEAEFVRTIGRLLQAWIDGDWWGAWVAVAPILIVALLLTALRLFLPEDLPFKRRRRRRL